MKRIILLPLFLLIAFSCRTRNADTLAKTGVRSAESDPAETCDVTLDPEAPFSAETFQEQLRQALNGAGRSGFYSEETFRDFLFSDEVPEAVSGSLEPYAVGGDACNLTRNINQSLEKPAYFYWLTGNGRTTFGGMTLYKGDVYAEGFYRNRREGVEGSLFDRKAYSSEELFTKQPWLEWDAENQRFQPRIGSPAARILEHLSAETGSQKLALHRGTSVPFASSKKALATKGSYPFGEFGGIFTTPDFSAARGWASPVVLTSAIDLKALKDAATLPQSESNRMTQVYVGIEYDYVEIAFLYSPGGKRNLFFDNVTSKCVVMETAEEADRKFAPACPKIEEQQTELNTPDTGIPPGPQ